MTITKTSRDLTGVERYSMTLDPEIKTVKGLEDGTVLNVTAWLQFEDVDSKTGETNYLTAFLTDEGTAYAVQSKTFVESFMTIWDMFKDVNPTVSIIKISGVSKGGRDYVNCTLNKSAYN